jgi:hypothetical protein
MGKTPELIAASDLERSLTGASSARRARRRLGIEERKVSR